jgi:CRP/FNR family transcriptional regulator, cyclic AMP receptor protein
MNQQVLWGNPFSGSSSTDEDIQSFLAAVPIFDTLSGRQLKKIASLIHVRHFNTEEIVFRQGDPGVGMFILMSGEVIVYNEHRDLTCTKIAVLKRGDFFGDIALLNDSPRSATVVSSQESLLLGLFRPEILSLMDYDPKLGVRFIYRLSQIVAERLRLSTTLTAE